MSEDLSVDKVKTFLENEKKERSELCRMEIVKILDAHKCTLDIAVLLRENSIIPQLTIIAQDA